MHTDNRELIIPVEWTRRSLTALRAARVLARQTGRRPHLVSVIALDEDAAKRERHLAEAAKEYTLPNPEITVLRSDLKAHPVSREGSELMRFINTTSDALVCLSTHARGAIGDMVLGGVASGIIEHTRRSVVLTGPQFSADWNGPLQTLLVCLDGSPLSESIIEPATELATRTGATLMLVQVLNPDEGPGMGSDIAESGYLQSIAAGIRKQHDLKPDWDVLHGRDPGRSIAEYVAGFPGAMVAMTTHGYTGLRQLSLGSVTRDLVHMAGCPVLTFKPKTA